LHAREQRTRILELLVI